MQPGTRTTTLQYKIRVLCMVDYACNTGFATVSRNVIRRLQHFYNREEGRERLELTIIANNYFGEPYNEDAHTIVMPAALLGTEEARDAYGRHAALDMLARGSYHGLFIINDPDVILGDYKTKDGGFTEMLRRILVERRKKNQFAFKSIYYFPIDCRPMEYLFRQRHIELFNRAICYTQYGKEEIRRIRPELGPRIGVILHGVDTKVFFPIEDEKKVKQYRVDYFGDNWKKFIVTNVNRNQFRKDIPSTLYAFKAFQEKYCRRSFLYLHMDPAPQLGWDIRQVAEQLELVEGEDYQLPPPEYFDAGAREDMVNIIYNSCDLYLTTTTAEGFGLTILEAMAAGLPVVAPLHTSIPEITDQGRAIWGYENFYNYCDRYNNKIVWQCDYEEVAEKMNEACEAIHNNRHLTKRFAALECARRLTWDRIGHEWVNEFVNVFGASHVKIVKEKAKAAR